MCVLHAEDASQSFDLRALALLSPVFYRRPYRTTVARRRADVLSRCCRGRAAASCACRPSARAARLRRCSHAGEALRRRERGSASPQTACCRPAQPATVARDRRGARAVADAPRARAARPRRDAQHGQHRRRPRDARAAARERSAAAPTARCSTACAPPSTRVLVGAGTVRSERYGRIIADAARRGSAARAACPRSRSPASSPGTLGARRRHAAARRAGARASSILTASAASLPGCAAQRRVRARRARRRARPRRARCASCASASTCARCCARAARTSARELLAAGLARRAVPVARADARRRRAGERRGAADPRRRRARAAARARAARRARAASSFLFLRYGVSPRASASRARRR